MEKEERNSIAWDIISSQNLLVLRLIRSTIAIVISLSLVIVGIVGTFIWYLNQYDFTSTEVYSTVEATTESGGDASAVLNEEGQVNINGNSEGKEDH